MGRQPKGDVRRQTNNVLGWKAWNLGQELAGIQLCYARSQWETRSTTQKGENKTMKSTIRVLAFTVVFFAAMTAVSQQPPAPQPAAPAPKVVTPKSPYDVRDAKIAVITEDDLQKTANALTADYQRQMADLQAKWKEQDVALKAWEADVRKANGWDDTYVFNQQTYEWAQQPKPAEKKPAEAPKK
jgi:hypothetical protein